jgi:hypothetical protein
MLLQRQEAERVVSGIFERTVCCSKVEWMVRVRDGRSFLGVVDTIIDRLTRDQRVLLDLTSAQCGWASFEHCLRIVGVTFSVLSRAIRYSMIMSVGQKTIVSRKSTLMAAPIIGRESSRA